MSLNFAAWGFSWPGMGNPKVLKDDPSPEPVSVLEHRAGSVF
jgi:hypothetical protein